MRKARSSVKRERPVRLRSHAMTIEVEDYFPVSVFDASCHGAWTAPKPGVRQYGTDPRVVRRAPHQGDVLRARVGRRAFPEPRHADRLTRARSRLARIQPSPGVRPDAPRISRGCAARESAAGIQNGLSGARVPGAQLLDHAALSVGARHSHRRRLSLRFNIFPIRHDRYGIPLSPRHPYHIHRRQGDRLKRRSSTTALPMMNLPIAGAGTSEFWPYQWPTGEISRVNAGRPPGHFPLHTLGNRPGTPRLRTGVLGRFGHYAISTSTEHRLRALLVDLRFGRLPTCFDTSPAPQTMATARFGASVPRYASARYQTRTDCMHIAVIGTGTWDS